MTAATARVVYFFYFGVRFDDETLTFYMQFIDRPLLETSLVESLIYLRDQPPMFNLFLGTILKVFPDHSTLAFHLVFLVCGLILAASMYTLMIRMRVPPALAAVVTAFFAVNPGTILYENWLLYTYPIAAVLCLSALLLHRYLSKRRPVDGFMFFALLAIAVLTYGVFHLLWLLTIAGALLLAVRVDRRQVLVLSLLPIAAVLVVYAKNYLVFGNLSTGKVYLGMNLAVMTMSGLQPEEVRTLKQEGRVSPMTWALLSGVWTLRGYRPHVPPFSKTGVAMLDQEVWANGTENYHHSAWAHVGDVFYKDAIYSLSRYPRGYLGHFWKNTKLYFHASSDHHFDRRGGIDAYPNGYKLGPGIGRFHRVAAWSNWIFLPACVLFAAWFGGRWLARRFRHTTSGDDIPHDDAAGFTMLFGLFNILYLALVTVALSFSDQNRYRFSVMPFYYLFFAMLLWIAWNRHPPSKAQGSGSHQRMGAGLSSGSSGLKS